MNTLNLWFTNEGRLELLKTSYLDSRLGERLSYRGRKEGDSGDNFFRWSCAVHAMSLLALRTAAYARNVNCPACESVCISGKAGTPASSLDYALSKQPDWLLGMFGEDENGIAVARRIFARRNPERKRPGPVSLWIDCSVLAGININVSIEGIIVTSSETLLAYANALEDQWTTQQTKVVAEVVPAVTASPKKILHTNYQGDPVGIVLDPVTKEQVNQDFINIWQNAQDEDSAIKECSTLVGHLRDFPFMYLDYYAEIDIFNSSGDARIKHFFEIVNLGDAEIGGILRYGYFALPQTKDSFSIWAEDDKGAALKLHMMQDSPHYKEFFLCLSQSYSAS